MSIVAHSTTEQSRIPSGRKLELGAALSSQLSPRASWRHRKWDYPNAPSEGGVVESLHRCEIADPYRSLEILEHDSTQKYIREQNQVSLHMLYELTVADSSSLDRYYIHIHFGKNSKQL
jgi:hypothetical protein